MRPACGTPDESDFVADADAPEPGGSGSCPAADPTAWPLRDNSDLRGRTTRRPPGTVRATARSREWSTARRSSSSPSGSIPDRLSDGLVPRGRPRRAQPPDAACHRRPRAQCRPVGNDMKPGPERLTDPERVGLANQDQERGLEGVLGVVRVADQRSADAPDHRGMPVDQRGKRQFGAGAVSLIVGFIKSFEELPVRQADQGTDAIKCLEIPEQGRQAPILPQIMGDPRPDPLRRPPSA